MSTKSYLVASTPLRIGGGEEVPIGGTVELPMKEARPLLDLRIIEPASAAREVPLSKLSKAKLLEIVAAEEVEGVTDSNTNAELVAAIEAKRAA